MTEIKYTNGEQRVEKSNLSSLKMLTFSVPTEARFSAEPTAVLRRKRNGSTGYSAG